MAPPDGSIRTAPEPGGAVVDGEPMAVIEPLLGGPRIDHLLDRAVRRAPQRLAIRAATDDLTYAELDRRARRCATALRGTVGGDAVVALAMELSPAFGVGFFGIARAGNVSALVNPLLREEGLAHVLNLCRARAVIATPQMYRRLVGLRDRLPELRQILLTGRDGGPGLDAAPTLDDLVDAVGAAESTSDGDGGSAVACLQFTSGTTGPAKAVRLTHRNLVVNAAQTAYGHRLQPTSVLFNALPTFHLMHLTIGVTVAATQVLCATDDPVEAVRQADRAAATHFYSLPVRLIRLATDPRLPDLRAPSLRAVLSGGSAMPPSATRALSDRFGVPVVQGYGLAETSPSTHLGSLDRPRTGSCGPPVPGTRCRIVDVETRSPLPVGEKGEIQVAGPQLMLGYLDHDPGAHLDPDGWFSTGDVGYVDADGYLFVVDRLKDVFKCDNWLVSPTEIERVLMRHPAVADCVVVDYPHPLSAAVAYALVVPRTADADPAELAAFVNARMPYYEHLRNVDLVAHIARSPTGKVDRRTLRRQVLDRHPVT